MTETTHTCENCGGQHEVDPGLEEILARVDALTPEQASLLNDTVLHIVAEGLSKLTDDEETPPSVAAKIGVMLNLTVLAGYSGGAAREGLGFDTEEGPVDETVQDIYTDFVHNMKRQAGVGELREGDLPPGVAERFYKGEQTEEDVETAKRIVAEKFGADPESVEFTGVLGTPKSLREDENDHYVPVPDLRYL